MTTNTNTNPWWAVYWNQPQTGRGAVAKNGHNIVQAGSSAEAAAAVQGQEPAGTVIVNTLGPYATQAAAQTVASNPDTSVTGATVSGAADNIPNPLSGLAAIGAFFSKLGNAKLWERIAEVALGLVLIAVGVAKIVPSFTPAAAVARAVKGATG